jgi:hypothetical protein
MRGQERMFPTLVVAANAGVRFDANFAARIRLVFGSVTHVWDIHQLDLSEGMRKAGKSTTRRVLDNGSRDGGIRLKHTSIRFRCHWLALGLALQ